MFYIDNILLRRLLIEPVVMLATIVQWLVLAVVTGALVGTCVSFFLAVLLQLAGRSFGAPVWVQALLLPVGGLANGLLLYYGYQLKDNRFSDSMIATVHSASGRVPLKTALIKPVAAIMTLACGGSAGKEGPCSHIGGSIGGGVGQLLHVNPELQKRLVACGVSAGFASVFGTPIAGAIYGVEVLAIGRIRHDFLLPAILAGVTAYQTSVFWGVPYPHYHVAIHTLFSEWLFLQIVVIGIACGLVARLYVDGVQLCKRLFGRLQTAFNLWPPFVPVIGGGLLALLVLVLPVDYFGLSLPLLHSALAGHAMPWFGFLWKILLVAITLGSGFYGGVVTPQFVIGAVTGSWVAQLFGIHPALGAAVGLVAVVASASNTPIAAILMGVELFGGASLLYISGAAMSAYLMVGHRSIYPDQYLAFTKSSWLRAQPNVPVGQEKIKLSYGLLRWWQKRDK